MYKTISLKLLSIPKAHNSYRLHLHRSHAQLVCSLAVLWATYSRLFWSGLVGANMTTKLQWIFQVFASAFLSRNSSKLRHLDFVLDDGSFRYGKSRGRARGVKFWTSAMLQEPEPTLPRFRRCLQLVPKVQMGLVQEFFDESCEMIFSTQAHPPVSAYWICQFTLVPYAGFQVSRRNSQERPRLTSTFGFLAGCVSSF